MYMEQCLLLYINLKFEVEYNLNIILLEKNKLYIIMNYILTSNLKVFINM